MICTQIKQPRFYTFTNTLAPLPTEKIISPEVLLTFHHILLVVTIIVTVCGSIIDIKAMDWGVVVTCWNILEGMEKKQVDHAQRNYHVSRTTGGQKFYPSLELKSSLREPGKYFCCYLQGSLII